MKRATKQRKIDMIVKGVCIYWIVFVVVAWITYWFKSDLPESLIQYGLSGGAIELVLSAAIEILSNKGSSKNE